MEKFYVDRNFGGAIWIDVENGIVHKCYGETEKFNAKMEENYKGKPISFLKTDFEERMKPFCHVRCAAIISDAANMENIQIRIRNLTNLMTATNNEEEKKRLRVLREGVYVEEYEYQSKLDAERERVKNEHNYDFKF
jgi:hypothetical protein